MKYTPLIGGYSCVNSKVELSFDGKTVEGIASDSTISFFEGEPDFVIMVKQ